MASTEGPVLISSRLQSEMVEHARACLPDEACGLLVGRGREVDRFVPVTNVEASPDSYTLDPEQHYRVLRDVEDSGLEIVGGFHSHPASPAVPSDTDITLAGEPGWVWIIAGHVVSVPDLRAWSIRGSRVEEVAIR